MINQIFRMMSRVGLLLAVLGFSQNVPIQEPHLLPFPSLNTGLSYFSLIPTQNLELSSSSTGWTLKDTLSAFTSTMDIELLRYRWWDNFFAPSEFDAYSSLGYSIFNQFGSFNLPSTFPSSFELNRTVMTGFGMSAMIKELYLSHHITYSYNHRGSLHANLATGIAHLSLYKNSAGVRILESNSLGLHVGLGWKTTLLGRVGKRIRIGLDMGYSFRNFDLTEQDENLKLASGTSGSLSPIQSVSFNTPELQLNLEFGEVLFAAHTPFRDPYKLGLLNLSMGTGWISYQNGVTLQFDSTGTSPNIPFYAKISQNYDLQVIKYNWPFHLIRQANIDVFSGMGVRYWRTSYPVSLPSGWATKLSDGSREYSGLRLAPKIIDIYLDHEILYPLGPRLHAKIGAGTGYATMTLYENTNLERLINATGFTWKLSGGLGYTIKGDGSSKVDIGLGFAYYHQAFDIDLSNSNISAVYPGEIIPISKIDLSQPVISFTIGLIFGGNPNAADKAFKKFKENSYTKALEVQNDLLKLYPNHHNKQAVLLQKQMIEDSLITRYYRDVRIVLSQGELENAFALIKQGEKPPGKAGERAVIDMKNEISGQALLRAGDALKNLDYEQAEDLILLALRSNPASIFTAKALLSRSYIIRATVLYRSGVFGRSLYWLKQADGLTDRYKLITDDLRLKIGDGRLDDANEGILREDRKMVYESMKEAKALNPFLGKIVDEHLKDLEQAIKHVDNEELIPLKQMALENLLDDVQGLDPDNFTPQVGMKGSIISHYVGPPKRRFKEGEYELWVYPKPHGVDLWLYLRDGVIEKIEYQK